MLYDKNSQQYDFSKMSEEEKEIARGTILNHFIDLTRKFRIGESNGDCLVIRDKIPCIPIDTRIQVGDSIYIDQHALFGNEFASLNRKYMEIKTGWYTVLSVDKIVRTYCTKDFTYHNVPLFKVKEIYFEGNYNHYNYTPINWQTITGLQRIHEVIPDDLTISIPPERD